MLLPGLLSIACSVCFFTLLRATSPGMAQSAVGWVLPDQEISLKTCPQAIWWRHFLKWVPSSQMSTVIVNYHYPGLQWTKTEWRRKTWKMCSLLSEALWASYSCRWGCETAAVFQNASTAEEKPRVLQWANSGAVWGWNLIHGRD